MLFIVIKQLIHQESGPDNLHQFSLNAGPLLPKPALWFWISQGDLIIMALIMVILIFNLQSIHLNLPLTLFQIRTTLQSNKLIMLKLTNYWNYSTHSTIMIFWVLASKCFRLDQWFLLPQNYIKYILCCFIETEKQILVSQTVGHNVLRQSKPIPI